MNHKWITKKNKGGHTDCTTSTPLHFLFLFKLPLGFFLKKKNHSSSFSHQKFSSLWTTMVEKQIRKPKGDYPPFPSFSFLFTLFTLSFFLQGSFLSSLYSKPKVVQPLLPKSQLNSSPLCSLYYSLFSIPKSQPL